MPTDKSFDLPRESEPRWVRSLSIHDSFGTKRWSVSVHDDFGTYEINFGTCVFVV